MIITVKRRFMVLIKNIAVNSFSSDATNKIQGFRAYKNSITVVGSLITHLGTAGRTYV